MKTNIFKLFCFLAAFCFTTISCVKSDSEVKISLKLNYSGGIDFEVTNVTTGEKIDGATGIMINVNGEASSEGCLSVHAGDLLRLNFTPPEKFSGYSWEATYTLFGETFVKDAPFVMEYTVGNFAPGEYEAEFSGKIDDTQIIWDEESHFSTSVTLRVE